MYKIGLHYVTGYESIFLRDIYGLDELSITSYHSQDAIQLLDRLILKMPNGNEEKINASVLPVAERDYLLVAVRQRIFGPKIESNIVCSHCKEKFNLDFSLADLVSLKRGDQQEGNSWYQGDGTFKTNDLLHFRLPTGQDENCIMGMPSELAKATLHEKCLITPSNKNGKLSLEDAMGIAGPLMETILTAECPECNHQQDIAFSIQHFFLSELLQERKQTMSEFHQIAMNYKWSNAEILHLPRTIRKAYAQLINGI